MLGGQRIFLSQQEQYVFLTPVAPTVALPNIGITLGSPPIVKRGAYTPSIISTGAYTPSISKTAGP